MKSEKKSFSLVEVIVAAVILALVITGMFVVFKSGEKFSSEDKQKVMATNLSRQVIEELKSIAVDNFNHETLETGKHDNPNETLDFSDPLKDEVISRDFYYTVSPGEDADGDGEPDYKRIEVTYEWTYWEEDREPEKVTLSAIVSGGQAAVSEIFP